MNKNQIDMSKSVVKQLMRLINLNQSTSQDNESFMITTPKLRLQ
jgi:hypothetical protein